MEWGINQSENASLEETVAEILEHYNIIILMMINIMIFSILPWI